MKSIKSVKPVANYDDPSFNYKQYWQKRRYEHLAEELALKKFFKLIPQRNSLIDIGGGFGRLTPVYAPLFKKTLLIDPSERLLKKAQKLTKKYSRFETAKGIVSQLPCKNASFDVALMIRAIHHLSCPETAFKEVRRILKLNGYFILELANKFHFKACLKAFLRLNFRFFTDLKPMEKSEEIVFLNFPPREIKRLLAKNGLKIIKLASVSNFRSVFLKKVFPLKILLFLENWAQKTLSFAFGPSIFLLTQKNLTSL